jgi:hypothetical protein
LKRLVNKEIDLDPRTSVGCIPLKLPSTLADRIKNKQGVSKSNLITSVVVGGFVILVISALVLAYLVNPTVKNTSSTTPSLYFSGVVLISGSASSSSLNTTCSGDSQLEIYVTNSSPNTISMTNVIISASRLLTNATSLVPLSNGCVPVSEDNPPIQSGSNDLLILTYPSIPVPPYTNWNVTIDFSNGQRLSQSSLTSEPT